MQTISEYVDGLKIPTHCKQPAIDKLQDAGFTRYDRYYWQEIENIVQSVVDEKTKH